MYILCCDVPLWLILASLIGILFIWKTFISYNVRAYWKSVGVPTLELRMPFFGTILAFRKGLVANDLQNRKTLGKIIGADMGGIPMLQVTDQEVMKEIYVKQFSNFCNRRNVMEEPPSRSMLSSAKDAKWKKIRSILSPTFSSGRLKQMTRKISTCAENMCSHLEEIVGSGQDIQVKDVTGAYTMDVIASVAFGIELDSQKDPNSPFVKHAKRSFNFTFTNPIILFFVFFPSVADFLNKRGLLQIFPKSSVQFFTDVVDKVLKERQAHKDDKVNTKTDFIQLMVNAGEKQNELEQNAIDDEINSKYIDQSPNEKGLSHEEIVANGMIFLLAGYETTATALSFLIYSMAINPDIQEKAIQEIDEKAAGKDTGDFALYTDLTYLDMCVNETLRMYPPVSRSQRVASRDSVVCGITIKEGTIIDLPVFPLHYDEEVWPNPQTFRPERFTAEAKSERSPFDFAPFGQGPRNCIGMRLALLEVKVAMVHILSRFRVVKCDKTQVPMTFANNSLLAPERPITVRFLPRNTAK